MDSVVTINQLQAVKAYAMKTLGWSLATNEECKEHFEGFKEACSQHGTEWNSGLYGLLLLERESILKGIAGDISPMSAEVKSRR